MKHLLIAASALAMTAGVAQADITFSGSANAGIAVNGTKNITASGFQSVVSSAYTGADAKYHAYSDFTLSVAASGTTDSGLTFGVSDSIHGGVTYALGNTDAFETKDGTLGTPTVYISGSFGKISFSANNLDAYNTDVTWSGSADVQYDGTFGGVALGVVADIESGDAAVMASYTAGPLSLSADYNTDSGATDLWDASIGYTMGDFTGTLSATNDNGAAFDTAETLKLAYSAGGVGAWVKGTTAYGTTNAEFAVGGSYASGPMSLTVEVDDVTQANHTYTKWTVTGGYDMGNGLALTAGTNYTGDVMVGATMSF